MKIYPHMYIYIDQRDGKYEAEYCNAGELCADKQNEKQTHTHTHSHTHTHTRF